MSAIRLEKFTRPHAFQSTARVISEAEIEAIRQEGFEDGVREGAAAASEAFSSEQSRSLIQIQELVEDAFFTREEAHQQALCSLRPLIASLIETFTRVLDHTDLVSQIAGIIDKHTRNGTKSTLEISVAQGLGPETTRLLDQQATSVAVIEDPTLTDVQARVSWGGGFDSIDLDSTVTAVTEAVESFFSELNQPYNAEVQHGN